MESHSEGKSSYRELSGLSANLQEKARDHQYLPRICDRAFLAPISFQEVVILSVFVHSFRFYYERKVDVGGARVLSLACVYGLPRNLSYACRKCNNEIKMEILRSCTSSGCRQDWLSRLLKGLVCRCSLSLIVYPLSGLILHSSSKF